MRARPLPALVVSAALLVAACGGDDAGGGDTGRTDAPTTVGEATEGPDDGSEDTVSDPIGTHEVAEVRRTFVDATRTTPAHGGEPELPERTIPVVVYAPDGEPGPWPLIVFGHGSSRAGDHYEGTLTAWASAGYVVVAPDYPLSSEGTPGGTKFDEIENQTGDVAFLIDEAEARFGPDGSDEDLAGTVDPERVGLGGQSFGGITALGAGFNVCCAEPRVDAVVAFASRSLLLPSDEQDPSTTDRPLLMVHGSEDSDAVDYDSGRDTFFTIFDAPGAFITLVGADHDDGYFDGPVDPWGTVATEAALAFFDTHLKDDPAGPERVRAVVADAGPDVATIEER